MTWLLEFLRLKHTVLHPADSFINLLIRGFDHFHVACMARDKSAPMVEDKPTNYNKACFGEALQSTPQRDYNYTPLGTSGLIKTRHTNDGKD